MNRPYSPTILLWNSVARESNPVSPVYEAGMVIRSTRPRCSVRDSNSQLPVCKTDTLPVELTELMAKKQFNAQMDGFFTGATCYFTLTSPSMRPTRICPLGHPFANFNNSHCRIVTPDIICYEVWNTGLEPIASRISAECAHQLRQFHILS